MSVLYWMVMFFEAVAVLIHKQASSKTNKPVRRLAVVVLYLYFCVKTGIATLCRQLSANCCQDCKLKLINYCTFDNLLVRIAEPWYGPDWITEGGGKMVLRPWHPGHGIDTGRIPFIATSKQLQTHLIIITDTYTFYMRQLPLLNMKN